MPIDRLLLVNFQKWKHYDIRFDEHITVLTGPTDAGKSSIIRALWWLATNPRGDFTRHGAETCFVKARIDGRTARRSRKGNQNSYGLGRRVFKAFRRSVPSSVADLLRVEPSVSFQDQHDPPFWFSLTPGQLSRELNQIVDLGTIDRVQASCLSRSKKAKADVETAQARLESAKGKRKELAWVLEADAELEHIEQLSKQLEDTNAQIDSLARAIKHAERHKRLAARAADLKQSGRNVVILGGRAVKRMQQSEGLERIIQSIERTKRREDQCRRRLAKLERRMVANIKGRCPLCGAKVKGSSHWLSATCT